MTAPTFRNPHLVQETPLRWFLREHCPSPAQGLTVEDLDVVPRSIVWSPLGRFRLVEHKCGTAPLGTSKKMTFGLMDALLRKGDPLEEFYDGWYVLRTRPPTPQEGLDYLEQVDEFKVNSINLTRAEFISWFSFGEPDVPPRPPQPTFAALIADRFRAGV